GVARPTGRGEPMAVHQPSDGKPAASRRLHLEPGAALSGVGRRGGDPVPGLPLVCRAQGAETGCVAELPVGRTPWTRLYAGDALRHACRMTDSGRRVRRTRERPAGIVEYRLPGDWLVLAGRTDEANEYLSLELAGPGDLWFHIRGMPGGHV